jgi:hypothetical protein
MPGYQIIVQGNNRMASVGMIHLACYCGAELFYLGEAPENLTNQQIIELLHEKLGPGNFGILTPAEDLHGECPYCGLVYELPEPHMLKHLPYGEHGRVRSALSNYRQARAGKSEIGADANAHGRYLS